MKHKTHLHFSPLRIMLFGLAVALPCTAAEIDVPDYSLVPDGQNLSTTFQHTDIKALNGNASVLTTGTPKTVYVITTFTFGAASDAHLQWQFSNSSTAANRIGLEVQDTGLVQTLGTGAGTITVDSATLPNRTSVNLAQDMAGQTVTLLAKLSYDADNSVIYGRTSNTADDTLMNVWINPDLTDVEGSGITAGDLYALWNSAGFDWFRQTIQNQNTPPSSGSSSITNTTILTGADATWANALALATGGTEPGAVDPDTSTVTASPTAVPADGVTTTTITVTLRDAENITVPGKEVSLEGNGSAVIATSNNISDAGGVVTFTVRSGTAGTETFAATVVTDDHLLITQTAAVDFQEVIPVGPVDAGTSMVVATPSAVTANGIAISTITVTLKDSNGALVVGENVTLTDSPAVANISPEGAQTTDANGQAVFAVSSTTIGTVSFSATSATDSITLTDTAGVEFVDPATTTAYNVSFLDEDQAEQTGQVGVVGSPGEIWNQGTTSVNGLVDTTGTVISAVSVSGLGNDGRTIPSATLSVFRGVRNFTGKGLDATISITGLEANTAYDLYIYSLSHNSASWGKISDTERASGEFVTANTVLGNGQSQWLDNAVPGTNASNFVPNGNYVVFQSIVSDASGNISVVADAYDGIDGNPATNDGNTRLHVNALQIRPASGMSVDYMNWRESAYPGIGMPEDDDDGDGFSNNFERIFGMDPTDPASASPFVNPFDAATGTFSYSRRNPSLVNLDYKLWFSTNLEEWFQDNGAFQSIQSTANGIETVDVVIDRNLLAEPKLFLQMRASAVTGIDLEPALLNIRGGSSTMTLLFSQPMHPSTAANPANYTVELDGVGALGITGASVSGDGASVTLTLDSTLGNDTAYTVTLDGLTSGTGQSMASGFSRSFKTWDDNPTGVKVFIVAGQSNMVGRGESERGNGDVPGAIGSLRYQVVNDNANYGQLVVDSGNPATDPWVVRNDVRLYWNRADIGAGPAISQGGLAPVFGSGATTFGPEYGIGWALGEHLAEPVLIIKTAWGGKDLVNNFRPPGAVAARGGSVGPYYIEMIEQVREVLENFDSLFPEWSAQGYQIAGFGWHQGWNDSLDSFASNEYEANMANFITDIRADFNKPQLPFAIGTTGMEGAATSGNRLTVVNAQINVANPTLHPELGGNVFTVDTRPFARTTEQSPTNDTTHWKNNGESMWLIGNGMGRGIVDLLAR